MLRTPLAVSTPANELSAPKASFRSNSPRVPASLGTLLRTRNDSGATAARLTLGLIMLPHGAQHALGWLGGYGFTGTLNWMTGTLGFPTILAALAIITELAAPIALILGLAGRAAAFGIAAIMLGALTTHAADGFFMNWFGAMPTGREGFEYHLLALGLATVVLLNGSGRWSVDRRLTAHD